MRDKLEVSRSFSCLGERCSEAPGMKLLLILRQGWGELGGVFWGETFSL